MSPDEVGCHEGRLEYWDAETELAWMLRDVSPRREEACSRLAALVHDVAEVRGTPISMYGNANLQRREFGGRPLTAVQADQVVYLQCPEHPLQVIVVGVSPRPDVVFEVALTTDVRERKLDVYMSWGVPEVWVEVPDAGGPSKRQRPGLTIHVHRGKRYEESAESTAFPTWSAREIHNALNEASTSTMTVATVRRVGKAMGRLVRTGLEYDPLSLGAQRLAGRREGEAGGMEAGRSEGREADHRQVLLEERLATLEGLLAARNIPVEGRLDDEAERIAAMPRDAMLKAGLECADVADLLRCLRSEH